MATFWGRIREIFYGGIAEDADLEVGAIATVEPLDIEEAGRDEGRHEGAVRVHEMGGELWIAYSGQLTKAGRPIYVHYGHGPGAWRKVRETRMDKLEEGLHEAIVPLDESEGVIEFCFRNDVGDWDNNDGNNWSYRP